MMEAARRGLAPERVVDVILPLAVAVFRFTSPVGNLAVCFFIAHLYGLHPSVLQTAGAVAVAYAMSIGAVGLPGQVCYISSIAPICLALGVPTDLLGIFLAVEVMPDIFRTLGNVTGDLAVTSILARGEKGAAAAVKPSDGIAGKRRRSGLRLGRFDHASLRRDRLRRWWPRVRRRPAH